VDARDLKGLGAFAQLASRRVRRLVVDLGARRQRLEGVEVIPLDEFLAELPSSPTWSTERRR
jgi:hypothetical protein